MNTNLLRWWSFKDLLSNKEPVELWTCIYVWPYSKQKKNLQRFGTFKEDTHISLLSYRLAFNRVQNLCLIPWFTFDSIIGPKWPLRGNVDFRRLIKKKYDFPIADALNCFWPIGCNFSGNPHLSAKEALNSDLRSNTFLLIGCDEERIANGTYMIDNTFRRCISHFIKDSTHSNTCDTLAPTVSLPNLHHGPTVPPTSSNIYSLYTFHPTSSMPSPLTYLDLLCTLSNKLFA